MKKLLASLSCILVLNLNADTEAINITDKGFKVTLDWLDEKPKSYAKDFFIIQYLNQKDISEVDAQTAYDMLELKKEELKKLLIKDFLRFQVKIWDAIGQALKNY